MSESPDTFTRQELYDLVWSEPVRTLSPRFQIPDVAIAKLCRQNLIPLPPRGYWAKQQAGKSASRVPLPPRGLGMAEVIHVGGGRNHYYYYTQPPNLIDMEIPPPPVFTETVGEILERVRNLVGKVSIPKDFTRAHKLIARLLEEDEARRQKQFASSYPFSWDDPRFESPFERRRLRLLNAIFVALERTGMKPSFTGKDPNDFSARVGVMNVPFKLDHPGTERASYKPSSSKDRPASDKLEMKIGGQREAEGIKLFWEDDAKGKIETHVQEMVISIIAFGEIWYREREIHYNEWLHVRKADLIEDARKQKLEEERIERERMAKAEKARVDRLLGEAADLARANQIRTYVETVKSSAAADKVTGTDLQKWIAWAIEQADRIDPILSRKFLGAISDLHESEELKR